MSALYPDDIADEQQRLCDPYGLLGYAVGTADDFICFDYAECEDGSIQLHAVVNSETGGFIEDFEAPFVVPREQASMAASGMVFRALQWLMDNELEHDVCGWSQDPWYFGRVVAAYVKGTNDANPNPGNYTAEYTLFLTGGSTMQVEAAHPWELNAHAPEHWELTSVCHEHEEIPGHGTG